MTDKEKYDFIDHVVHLTLIEEGNLLDEHGGDYDGLEKDGIDSNGYYRIITERVVDILKKKYAFMQEEPVSEDLEEAAEEWDESFYRSDAFKAGAEWQKENLWKPADGDDLPIIDREVIALLDNGKVVFAHRPPEYWDGKDIVTGKVTRNYPKTYDKGGWNIPNIKYWLDVELPKEIEP